MSSTTYLISLGSYPNNESCNTILIVWYDPSLLIAWLWIGSWRIYSYRRFSFILYDAHRIGQSNQEQNSHTRWFEVYNRVHTRQTIKKHFFGLVKFVSYDGFVQDEQTKNVFLSLYCSYSTMSLYNQTQSKVNFHVILFEQYDHHII